MEQQAMQTNRVASAQQFTDFMLKQLELKSHTLESLGLRRDQTLQVATGTVSALLGGILIVAATTNNTRIFFASLPVLTMTISCVLFIAFSRYMRYNRMSQLEHAKLNLVLAYFASLTSDSISHFSIDNEITKFSGGDTSVAIGRRSLTLVLGLLLPPLFLGLTVPLSVLAIQLAIPTVNRPTSVSSESLYLSVIATLVFWVVFTLVHVLHFAWVNRETVKEIRRIADKTPN